GAGDAGGAGDAWSAGDAGGAGDASGDLPAGTPVEVRVFDADAAALIEPEEARWAGLRAAAPVLGDRDAGLFTEALALANWHESAQFCPRCGSTTTVVQAGWARRCDRDG